MIRLPRVDNQKNKVFNITKIMVELDVSLLGVWRVQNSGTDSPSTRWPLLGSDSGTVLVVIFTWMFVTSLGNKGRNFKKLIVFCNISEYICIKQTYIWPNPDENPDTPTDHDNRKRNLKQSNQNQELHRIHTEQDNTLWQIKTKHWQLTNTYHGRQYKISRHTHRQQITLAWTRETRQEENI